MTDRTASLPADSSNDRIDVRRPDGQYHAEAIVRYRGDAVIEIQPSLAAPARHSDSAARAADRIQIHRHGAIDVANGMIVGIGDPQQLPALRAQDREVTGRHLLMPGMVNTHCHAPMVLLRSVGDGLNLQQWLYEAIWPREAKITPQDVHLGMLAGSAEMLRSGVTTSVEMYLHDEQMIDAVSETGGRLLCTPAIISALHGHDVLGRMAEIERLHQRYHRPQDRISIGIGPHSTYDLDAATLREVAALAADLDTVIHIHLEETSQERQTVIDREGHSATKLLHDCGVLDRRVVLGHGIWLDAADRELLAAGSATVAHCPSSNLKLGCGFANTSVLAAAGINVGLGTDGAASADSLDLWNGLRIAPGIARAVNEDPTAMTAEEALLMATANGGYGIGRPDLGSLTVGSRADFMAIRATEAVFGPGIDDHDLLAHLVFNGSGAYVDHVWVDGQQVVNDGVVMSIDEEAIWAELDRRARGLR